MLKNLDMRQQVVILSDHSLFSEGVASRFGQFPERVSLEFVNRQDEDGRISVWG
ncbi:MAG: hypothetical protein ISR58_16460 [Anaerolineales bacterium]|nr:hypothetical protein [Chloroflexota bacterium]MBL6982767.1 hypothetical protein [Anaerolineales bacterium]